MTITPVDTEANSLFTSLVAGAPFGDVTIASVDGYTPPAATGSLYAELTPLTNADLTTKDLNGTGTFDVLMGSLRTWLQAEYASNRISGAEYTKAFIAMAEGAMGTSAQFLLGRDQAYWQAVTAQIAAQTAEVGLVTAKVGLETAKAQLALVQAQTANAKAEFALNKAKLATESATYLSTEYTYENLLPAQMRMVSEQAEAQRGQTSDTRSDGSAVAGTQGSQKQLYAQQITSYKRDAEAKFAKLFTDAWVTQKTMDDGLVPPNGFTNANIDVILSALKTNIGF